MMAPERLRELRRLAVAHVVGHLSHRHRAFPQELECPLHPHLREVGAEGRAADLGKRPLELTPRGSDAPRHRVEIHVRAVVARDCRVRVTEDCGAALERSVAAAGGGGVHGVYEPPLTPKGYVV